MRILLSVISVAITFGFVPGAATAQDKPIVSVSGVVLQPCGLFGPSKRELMQQMIAQGRESNHTLQHMAVEQARQTELLRLIAAQTARAADASQQAAQSGQRAAEATYNMMDHMASPKLRDVPRGPNLAPPDIGALPDVPPTTSPKLRDVPRGPNLAPDLNNLPEVTGPILQGTRGRTYYASPPQRQTTRYTGYSLKN
jgi:hypothetical protein